MTALHNECRSSSSARKNDHIARAMVAVTVTSGIWKRVKRNRPIDVARARPANVPARIENAQTPMRNTSQQRATAESATGSRAAQSCTPNILKEIAISQYFRGDFSRY